MNKQILTDQIAGLISKGQNLRAQEAVFLKLQGINETIEKTKQERGLTQSALLVAKMDRKELIAKKNEAVSASFSKIIDKMGEVLPSGRAAINLDDGLFIGWEVEEDGIYTPYNGLSGGEKQIFDTALAHVLDSNIIIVEGAELDNDHLLAAMEDLNDIDKQVLMATCHPVATVPDSFKVIKV